MNGCRRETGTESGLQVIRLHLFKLSRDPRAGMIFRGFGKNRHWQEKLHFAQMTRTVPK